MTILFSHVGEDVVAEMADAKRRHFLEAIKLPPELVDWNHVDTVKTFAYPHCALASRRELIFDGQHKVDVALWVKPESIFALELKLGKTGLSAREFNKRFLSDCEKSHTRGRGTMISILEGVSSHVSGGGVSVKLGSNTSITLAPKWGLVVQESVLGNWARRGRPALSENVMTISIKILVDACCEREEFNALVTKQLPQDCYDSWLLGSASGRARTVPTHTGPPSSLYPQ